MVDSQFHRPGPAPIIHPASAIPLRVACSSRLPQTQLQFPWQPSWALSFSLKSQEGTQSGEGCCPRHRAPSPARDPVGMRSRAVTKMTECSCLSSSQPSPSSPPAWCQAAKGRCGINTLLTPSNCSECEYRLKEVCHRQLSKGKTHHSGLANLAVSPGWYLKAVQGRHWGA
uniref:Uncharacterized protein n=1 Tax=Myotis myotis TaxID=51298 RepID=A0A7J7YDB4_MYOMY|nr:hypothetical protein mMyoMyo1_010949 [Myotis myotis]